MANEEGATLLPGAPQPSPEQRRRARRAYVVRVALGVVSALALLAGSVVAVDLLSARQQHHASVQTSSLSETAPQTLESQFGWGTWCSARATIGCMFSSDKDKCQEDVMASCDPDDDDEEEAHEAGLGDGSGSGSGYGHGSGSGLHEHHEHEHVSTVGSGTGSTFGAVPSVGNEEKPTAKRKTNKKKNKGKKKTQKPPRAPYV